jgi:tellurite resistance protein
MGSATWVQPGTPITLAGSVIPGGLFYFGTSLPALNGSPDPSLINPSLSVAATGDYTEAQLGYWPSYSQISPAARRAYIKWLEGRRSDPKADIGFVFLFFYGLERRAVIDASTDEKALADLPAIAAEVQRLLDIYGGQSQSFKHYATSLLNWVSVSRADKLYEQPIPHLTQTTELPFYLRLALGQAVKDGVPIPGHLALAWVKYGNFISFRTASTRCPLEFDKLFLSVYEAQYGQGMPLSKNRTKLKLVHQAASAGLRGYSEMALTFNETPDVSVLKAPPKVLAGVVEQATNQLDSFSRYVGKNPGTGQSLEALVHLPVCAWPETPMKVLRSIRMRLTDGPSVMPFQDFLKLFGFKGALTKDKTELLAEALAGESIGVEPDILGGAKGPKPDEHVALFALQKGKEPPRTGGSYLIASLTLQLASAVAAADGDFSQDEANHLRQTVLSWKHLDSAQMQRLLASVQLLRAAPASLAALTKKLEPLERSVKETIAQFMATVAQADGTVSPDEVRMLERIYKALGLDSKDVFSNVHAVATGATFKSTTTAAPATGASTAGAKKPAEPKFKLDQERIAALQRDTDRVSSLLSNIFSDAEAAVSAAPAPAAPEPAEPEATTAASVPAPAGLLGLDETHASLARLLMSRPTWTRAELEDVAADLDVMLDGALETINDAAFDAHDMPFAEGDDPVTINPEFLEKVHA